MGNWSDSDQTCMRCIMHDKCHRKTIGTDSVQPSGISSATLPESVIQELADSRLSHAEKLMLIAVCIRSVDGKCSGSSSEIGLSVGITRRPTASEALARLQEHGLIEIPSGCVYWRVK